MVMSMRPTAAARKDLVQDGTANHLLDVEESPASDLARRAAAGAAQLIGEEPGLAFLDAIVVRLGDAQRSMIRELNQALVGDREAQLTIDGVAVHGC